MDSARPWKMPGWIVPVRENFSVNKRVCRKQTIEIVLRGVCLFSFSNWSTWAKDFLVVSRDP